MILDLHPEADTDRIMVLGCDRTDRSGSECTRPSVPLTSVADLDPGSGIGCFLTPGSGIRDGRK
jgi:hypothetical protein